MRESSPRVPHHESGRGSIASDCKRVVEQEMSKLQRSLLRVLRFVCSFRFVCAGRCSFDCCSTHSSTLLPFPCSPPVSPGSPRTLLLSVFLRADSSPPGISPPSRSLHFQEPFRSLSKPTSLECKRWTEYGGGRAGEGTSLAYGLTTSSSSSLPPSFSQPLKRPLMLPKNPGRLRSFSEGPYGDGTSSLPGLDLRREGPRRCFFFFARMTLWPCVLANGSFSTTRNSRCASSSDPSCAALASESGSVSSDMRWASTCLVLTCEVVGTR